MSSLDVSPDFASDLLRGAALVAEFIYGDRKYRRKIYHLFETSRIPLFKLGSVICGRRSVLVQWVAEQERRRWKPES